MTWSIFDALEIEPEIVQKWEIDLGLRDKVKKMSNAELLSLAIATRIFWSKKSYADFKPLSDCDGYQEWAEQFIE